MSNIRDLAIGQVLTAPSPADSGTTLTLNTGQGDDMPTITPFKVLAYPPGVIPTKYNAERLLVTDVTGDVLTIERAQGETIAQEIDTGWFVANAIFVDDMFNGSVVENEVPGGAVNGSNTVFTIASAGKVTGTLKVYKDGERLQPVDDYTETDTGFIADVAPSGGAVLLVDYRVSDPANYSVGTNSFIADEAVTGSINGSNDDFTTVRPYVPGSLIVYVNGLKQDKTTHVTETNPTTGAFSLDTPPATNDSVRVSYQYNLNPSGNSDTVDGFHAANINQAFPYGVPGDTYYYTYDGTDIFINGVDQNNAANTINWTKPANLKYVIVQVQAGGGGGGGSGTTNSRGGAGGGAGGYSRKKILAASLGSTETVTVGNRGAGGSAGANNGGNGGSSSFGSHCSATGGTGGGQGGGANGGIPGTGSNGDLNVGGGAGGPGNSVAPHGGTGGVSMLGGGGAGNTGDTGGSAPSGGYGGGGAGGARSTASQAGANGARGIVIIEEYF